VDGDGMFEGSEIRKETGGRRGTHPGGIPDHVEPHASRRRLYKIAPIGGNAGHYAGYDGWTPRLKLIARVTSGVWPAPIHAGS